MRRTLSHRRYTSTFSDGSSGGDGDLAGLWPLDINAAGISQRSRSFSEIPTWDGLQVRRVCRATQRRSHLRLVFSLGSVKAL